MGGGGQGWGAEGGRGERRVGARTQKKGRGLKGGGRSGGKKGGGPKGWGPKPRKRVGGGGLNFALFFFSFSHPPMFNLFSSLWKSSCVCSSLGVFLWNLGGLLVGRDPQMCLFFPSGCRVEPLSLPSLPIPREDPRKEKKTPEDSQREEKRHEKTPGEIQKETRRSPERGKNENGGGREKKNKTRIWQKSA